MELTSVIIKPYQTEKTYALREAEGNHKYAFVVHRKASKKLIALAFEAIFGIYPEAVNTINRKPSKTRTGTMTPGFKKAKKIAYITLPAGSDINMTQDEFENQVEATPVKEETQKNKEKKVTVKEVSKPKDAPRQKKAVIRHSSH